ncbi:MAG: hypothetical protein ICV87_07170, partial [Gemmatimonadetes bacterium]|nr:hypothetical protein [Gemmatimonadota bacterium]
MSGTAPARPQRALRLFIIFALVFYSNTVLTTVFFSDPAMVRESPISFVLQNVIGLVAFVALARRRRAALAVLHAPSIPILMALAGFSVLWAANPALTGRRALLLMMTTSVGILLATEFSPRERLEVIGWAIGTVMVLSFVAAVAFPLVGVEQGAFRGAWRGVFSQKNGLGRGAVFALLVFAAYRGAVRRNRV